MQWPGKMAIVVATDIFPTKIALVVTLLELILMQRNISSVMSSTSKKIFPCFLLYVVHTFQILVKTVPIKQGHKLIVVWPITPSIHNYKEGPCRYLGHLIGHEGKGSLFYILKTLGKF